MLEMMQYPNLNLTYINSQSNVEKMILNNVIKKEYLETAAIYFKEYDSDQNKTIDKNEFTTVLTNIGATPK